MRHNTHQSLYPRAVYLAWARDTIRAARAHRARPSLAAGLLDRAAAYRRLASVAAAAGRNRA